MTIGSVQAVHITYNLTMKGKFRMQQCPVYNIDEGLDHVVLPGICFLN